MGRYVRPTLPVRPIEDLWALIAPILDLAESMPPRLGQEREDGNTIPILTR